MDNITGQYAGDGPCKLSPVRVGEHASPADARNSRRARTMRWFADVGPWDYSAPLRRRASLTKWTDSRPRPGFVISAATINALRR
jgi:hypothetical protein